MKFKIENIISFFNNFDLVINFEILKSYDLSIISLYIIKYMTIFIITKLLTQFLN